MQPENFYFVVRTSVQTHSQKLFYSMASGTLSTHEFETIKRSIQLRFALKKKNKRSVHKHFV